MNRTGRERPLRIALLGTRGVPAHYGGFETCVEEVGGRLVALGHRVLVYCRRVEGESEPASYYQGMRLVYRPAMRRRSLETLSHTGASVAHLIGHGADVAIMFNAANAPWLPLLRAAGIPVATQVDGLEWQRTKWGRVGRRYYRVGEALSVRWSDAIIADAQGIADYYREVFEADSELISYGAPIIDGGSDRLAELDLIADGYHLVVARFEPENHLIEMVAGYRLSSARRPLVVVGSAPYAEAYTAQVHSAADERVRFLGGVWDQDLLNHLYAGSFTYLHGHSVGGTNPSLLRAIGAGAATIAYDARFNREVVGSAGWYFRSPQELARLLQAAEADPDRIRREGARLRDRAGAYDWDDVAAKYERLCRRLAAGDMPSRRPSGRRSSLDSQWRAPHMSTPTDPATGNP
jgi:glycosyltransferase involved in cell wall biosynthesis